MSASKSAGQSGALENLAPRPVVPLYNDKITKEIRTAVTSSPEEPREPITIPNSHSKMAGFRPVNRQRRRMTRREHQILEQAWCKDPNWTREIIDDLTKRLGISRVKLYKWTWDRRKKESKE